MSTPRQVSLFDDDDACTDGTTYKHARDHERLALQRQRVFSMMSDAHWRTLAGIAEQTGDPEASISARLRDFRKSKFGAHIVERRYVRDGLFEYRLLVQLDHDMR